MATKRQELAGQIREWEEDLRTHPGKPITYSEVLPFWLIPIMNDALDDDLTSVIELHGLLTDPRELGGAELDLLGKALREQVENASNAQVDFYMKVKALYVQQP